MGTSDVDSDFAEKYYTLLILTNEFWEIAFGDYDLNTVEHEREDAYPHHITCLILCSSDKQEDIDAIVQRINNKRDN